MLDAFARALPYTLRSFQPHTSSTALLHITGPAGGLWAAQYRDGTWILLADAPEAPDTTVTIDEETAWRGFTRGLASDQIRERAAIHGDPAIGDAIIRMVTVIA